MKTIIYILGVITIQLILFNCNEKSDGTNDITEYQIIKEDFKSSNKNTNVVEYIATYNKDDYSEEQIKNTLLSVYNNESKNVLKKDGVTYVFVIYLYTSNSIYEKGKSNWIGMFNKSGDDEPTITINEFKSSSLNNLNDSTKSSDEIVLDNLNTYLKERNLDLCTFSREIEDMESKTLKEADKKFPNFGLNHTEYLERIRNKELKKMSEQYNIHDSIFTYVNVFSMSYCK